MEVAVQIKTKTTSRKKKLTYTDYLRQTPPDSGNFELHDGKLIKMASPTPEHQDVVTELTMLMRLFAKQHSLGKVLTAPMDVVFSKNDVFQPDVLFISNARLGIIGDKKIEGAPDLVVEVRSESNSAQEMSYKRFIYESHEVMEYWVVDLKKRIITVSKLVDGEFEKLQVCPPDTVVKSEILTGFELAVSEIFPE